MIKQVCGSDNVTYDNKCLLEKTACEKNKEIKVVKHGRCRGIYLVRFFRLVNDYHVQVLVVLLPLCVP